jgi:ribosome biogenesis GTPase / thiamine phosphate phosphatase
MKGIVTKSTGSWCIVKDDAGIKRECRVKGKFRVDEIKSTNPVAVGDKVVFQMEKDNTGIIETIEPRKNYIIRKATKLSKQTHIIAANIDQALLVVSLVFPETMTGFIDRFLVTAEAYSIPSVLVFNKIDLYDEKTMEKLKYLVSVYEKIGYRCILVSAEKETNFDMLKGIMQGKVSLLAGNSGVGKSSIINKLEPGLDLKIADVSLAHHTGTHTTTFAEMFDLGFGASIIDTPGLKSFGIVDFRKEELFHYFPEMFRIVSDCKFSDCTHINEPGCAVKKALESGEVAAHRYQNYLDIYYGDELEVEY